MNELPDHLLLWFSQTYLSKLDRSVFRLVCRRHAQLITPIHCDAVTYAIRKGHVTLLKWLLKHCIITQKSYFELSKLGSVVMAEMLARADPETLSIAMSDEALIQEATLRGHMEYVLWQLEQGWQRADDSLCEYAAASGNLELVKTLVSLGYSLSEHSVCLAAMSGNVAMVRWMVERGKTIQDCTLTYTATGGNVEILYMIWPMCREEQKTSDATEEAARYGQTKMLFELLRLGCPYTSQVWYHTIENNNIEVLKRLVQGNYRRPQVKDMLRYADSREIIEYLNTIDQN